MAMLVVVMLLTAMFAGAKLQTAMLLVQCF